MDDKPSRRRWDRDTAATLTLYPDGPAVLRGDFEVRDVDGTVVPTGRVVALCRCGRSALKPLCDNSHQNAPRERTTVPDGVAGHEPTGTAPHSA